MNEKRVEDRTRQANWARIKRTLGQCAICGKPCTGYRCDTHKAAVRERQKLLMRQRRAAGLAK